MADDSATGGASSDSQQGLYTLRSGGWLLKVWVRSMEWVGEPEASAPSISVTEVARLLRKFAYSGRQGQTLRRDIEAGEYPELDAFKDDTGEWRVPVSSLQRYLKDIGAKPVPADYWVSVLEWGSFVQPPRSDRRAPEPNGNRPPRSALQRAWDEAGGGVRRRRRGPGSALGQRG